MSNFPTILTPLGRSFFYAALVFIMLLLMPYPVIADDREYRKFSSPVISLAVDSQGSQIFAGSGRQVHVLDAKLRLKKSVATELDFIYDLLIVDDQLFVAGGNPAEHGMLEVYRVNATNLEFQRRKMVHDDVIQRLTWHDQQLITAGADSQVHVLDAKTLQSRLIFKDHSKRVLACKTIPHLDFAVTGGLDHTLRVWSISKGQVERSLTHHQDDVLYLDVFRPTTGVKDTGLPQVVSVSRDKTVRFWQPTIGRLVRFKRFDITPTACHWIAGGDVLVGFENGSVQRISGATLKSSVVAEVGERIFTLKVVPDTTLVLGTKSGIRLQKMKP